MKRNNEHPNTIEVNRQQQQSSKEAKKVAFDWLVNTFPNAFSHEKEAIKPLKVGIINDIFRHLLSLKPAPVSRSKVRQVIQHYARRIPYLKQLQVAAVRVDLAGQPAGTVTVEEEAAAQRKIKRTLYRKNLRRNHYAKSTDNAPTEEFGAGENAFEHQQDFVERKEAVDYFKEECL